MDKILSKRRIHIGWSLNDPGKSSLMKFHTLEKQQRRKEVQRHQKKRKRKIALIMVDTVLSNCEPVLRKGQMD